METKLKKGINDPYSQWRRLSAGICTAQSCPAYLYLRWETRCFGLQLPDTFNWKWYGKNTDVTIAVKGLPSKKPLLGLAFPTLRKGIHAKAIKSGMSRRKNKGDNYLLFPTIQEVGEFTV